MSDKKLNNKNQMIANDNLPESASVVFKLPPMIYYKFTEPNILNEIKNVQDYTQNLINQYIVDYLYKNFSIELNKIKQKNPLYKKESVFANIQISLNNIQLYMYENEKEVNQVQLDFAGIAPKEYNKWIELIKRNNVINYGSYYNKYFLFPENQSLIVDNDLFKLQLLPLFYKENYQLYQKIELEIELNDKDMIKPSNKIKL